MSMLGGAGGGALGGAIAEAVVKVRADTSGFADEVEKGTGGRLGAVGQKMGMAVLAGAAAAGVKGVVDFTSFERGMNEVFTLIPEAGQKGFDKLTDQTKQFAKDFGVLPNEVIPSLYNSLSAGVPQDNVFEFLETANKLAKGGAADLGVAVDGLTSSMNAYANMGLTAEDASDAMFTAVKLGKTTVDELSSSMFQVAPIAASFGVGFDQVTASLASLTSAGVPTSVAATQMKAAISELGKDGTKAAQAFADATGQSFQEFIANGGSVQEAAVLMGDAASELGLSVVDMFGSIEAGAAFTVLSENADAAADTLAQVRDAAGATDEAFAQMEKGLGPVLDKLKAQFAVLSIEIGTKLAPTVQAVGQVLLGVVQVFSALPGPVQGAIVGVVLAGAAFLALAGPAMKMIAAIKGIGVAFKAMTTLLAANPWVLLIVGLVALVVVIVKNWDRIKRVVGAALVFLRRIIGAAWEWIRKATVAAWEAIGRAVAAAWDVIRTVFNTVLGALQAAVTLYFNVYRTVITGALNAILAVVTTVWNTIRTVFTTVLAALQTAVTTYFNVYRTIITTVLGAILAVITTVWDAIRAAVEAALNTIRAVVEAAFNAMRWVVEQAMDGIRVVVGVAVAVVEHLLQGLRNIVDWVGVGFTALADVARTVWDGLRTVVGGAVDFLVRKIGELREAAANALGPLSGVVGAASGIGGFVARGAAGLIPGLARGGTAIAGSPYWVGEDGPELFVPGRTGTVVPHGPSMAAAGGGGMTVQGPLLSISGPVTIRSDDDVTRLSRELAREADRLLRSQGTGG